MAITKKRKKSGIKAETRSPAFDNVQEIPPSAKSGGEKRLYFPRLDGLRFIAFLLVFFLHFHSYFFKNISNGESAPFLSLMTYGWIGVELFFVLSSFLLTKLAIKEIELTETGMAVGSFFMRRILRIWPLYFLYIFAMVVLTVIYKKPSLALFQEIWPWLLGLMTFTDNLWSSVLGYGFDIAITNHLWTISLEEQYYILIPFLIPLIIKLNTKNRKIFFLGVFVFLITMRMISVAGGLPHPFIWVLPIQCDAFLFGTALAFGLFDPVLSKINNAVKFILGVLAVASILLLPNLDEAGYHQVIIYTLIATGFTLIVDSVNNSGGSKGVSIILENRLIRYLGKISFGLYIFHMFAIIYLEDFIYAALSRFLAYGTSLFWCVFFICILLSTIFIAAISYEFYEKKFLAMKERFSVIKSRPI